jgi:hypothetical protein
MAGVTDMYILYMGGWLPPTPLLYTNHSLQHLMLMIFNYAANNSLPMTICQPMIYFPVETPFLTTLVPSNQPLTTQRLFDPFQSFHPPYSTASSSIFINRPSVTTRSVEDDVVGVNTKNPFSISLESLDELSRRSRNVGAGKASFDKLRNDVGRDDGGDDDSVELGVNARNVFNPGRF